MEIVSFHHVAIAVKDAALSIEFYQKLGFQVVKDYQEQDASVRVVHMQLKNFILEIFTFAQMYDAPSAMNTREQDLCTVGTKHFAMRVHDIQMALKEVESLGIVAVDNPPKVGRTGIEYFFIKDPDANWVEFVQDNRGFLD